VVSQNSHLLAPIAVDAVLKVIDPATATNVDLRDIRVSPCPLAQARSARPVDTSSSAQIVKKVGGTVDDTELIEGLVFTQKASRKAGGPSRIANAKIALLQFCISPPKTDVRHASHCCLCGG